MCFHFWGGVRRFRLGSFGKARRPTGVGVAGVALASRVLLEPFPPLVGGGGEGPEGYYTTLESMGVGVVWGVLWLRGPGLWFQDAWIERSRRCIDGSDMGGQIEFSMRRFQMNPDAPVARG